MIRVVLPAQITVRQVQIALGELLNMNGAVRNCPFTPPNQCLIILNDKLKPKQTIAFTYDFEYPHNPGSHTVTIPDDYEELLLLELGPKLGFVNGLKIDGS